MKKGSLLGGTLLVAGTCIGGGMLALPVLSSLGGFVPSMVLFLVCWLIMMSTGLLFLEVCHFMDGETNIISMADKTLGKAGKYVAWFIYLFFFYCVTIAYIVGSGNFVTQLIAIPEWFGPVIFVVLFAPFVFAGAKFVDRINSVFMIGLGISYVIFVFLGYQYIKPDLLAHKDWSLSLIALPIAFASFGFQGIVPTLSHYMGKDKKRTQKVIIFGSLLPFLAYVVWQGLILGIVPVEGVGGLMEALQNGENAVVPLKNFLDNPKVYHTSQYFAFFALATSFLGVTLGLLDFLADGLKIEKTHLGKSILCLFVFLPPLFIGIIYPHIFLTALDYAGGFGATLLLGLLPIFMVWVGRYRLGYKDAILPGGRPVLILLASLILFEVVFEIFVKLKNAS